MPGQEKMVMDFYQKNPSAVASLRGTVYEEKILNLFKGALNFLRDKVDSAIFFFSYLIFNRFMNIFFYHII